MPCMLEAAGKRGKRTAARGPRDAHMPPQLAPAPARKHPRVAEGMSVVIRASAAESCLRRRRTGCSNAAMPYEAQQGDVVMAFGGEAMISRALKPFREERFLALRELLHSADVRFVNGEMLFHNYEDPPTYLSQTYMRCDPRFIADLQWFGVNLLSCANNHAYDYGERGVLTNIQSLDQAGHGPRRHRPQPGRSRRTGLPRHSQRPRSARVSDVFRARQLARRRAAPRHAGPSGRQPDSLDQRVDRRRRGIQHLQPRSPGVQVATAPGALVGPRLRPE